MAADKPLPEIIAHRGESYDAPENTMAAFMLGWERDLDAVELDVHLTRDGRLICIHDKDTQRTTGVKHLVVEKTLAELQELDAGSWKGPQFAGEKMPTLDDVLPTIPPGKRLFIEIKVGPESVPEFKRALAKAGKPPEQTPVISFNLETCREVKRQLPDLQVYYLSSFKQDKETGQWAPTAEQLIQQAKDAKLDGLDLSFKGPIDEAFVAKIRDAGLGYYVWTVDDPDVARRHIELGVDGITTNRGAWLREQLLSHDETTDKRR